MRTLSGGNPFPFFSSLRAQVRVREFSRRRRLWFAGNSCRKPSFASSRAAKAMVRRKSLRKTLVCNRRLLNSSMAARHTMSGLIEGLPDAVALTCLARVPFSYHRNLWLVCRSWRAALCGPDIFKARCEGGVSEELLCVVKALGCENVCRLYDPCRGHWLTLNVMPSQLRYRDCVGVTSVAGKLFVLGGCGGTQISLLRGDDDDVATNEVWSYDPFCCEWFQRANMLVPRARFACCSLDGKIVVAGGFTSSDKAISKAEIYDPDNDTWRSLPDLPHTHTSACSAVVIGGKIHVLHEGYSAVQILEDSQQWFVEDLGWHRGLMAVIWKELSVVKGLNAGGFILKQHRKSNKKDNTFLYRLVVPCQVSNFENPFGFRMTRIGFRMIGLEDGPDGFYVIGPGMANMWNEQLRDVDVLSVNNNSPIWRNVSRTLGCIGIILDCTLLKV